MKLLREILDHPYPFTYKPDSKNKNDHYYHFVSDTGTKMKVMLSHDANNENTAHMGLSSFDKDKPHMRNFDSTGYEKNNAHRVYSTVKNIVTNHFKMFPKIQRIVFHGYKRKQDELYGKILKHYAKKSGFKFNKSMDGFGIEKP